MNMPLVSSIFKGMAPYFEDYVLYFPVEGDCLVVATKNGMVPNPKGELLAYPSIRRALGRFGINSLQDIELRRLGSRSMLEPLINSYDIPANSDYYPVLDQQAARSRFLNENALKFLRLRFVPLAFSEILEGRPARKGRTDIDKNFLLLAGNYANQAMLLYRYFSAVNDREAALLNNMNEKTRILVQDLEELRGQCRPEEQEDKWLSALRRLAWATIPYLTAGEMGTIWGDLESDSCYQVQPDLVHVWLELYRAVSSRDLAGTLNATDKLLPAGKIPHSKDNSYLVAAAMLSHLGIDNKAAAVEIWGRYLAPDELPMELRLLASTAGIYLKK
jgi:hypothetical protein